MDTLYRGFTGHEHLPEFGLINMNGRMYDPLIGRMLSPDNFVQSPCYSQSYNRYSYCWNNPLKFTDHSGQNLDNFLRSLVNMHVLPFRAGHAPINYVVDYLSGKDYAAGNFSLNYLMGNGAPYHASGGTSPGSTAYSNWSRGSSGPGNFVDAAGDEYILQAYGLAISPLDYTVKSDDGGKGRYGIYYETIQGWDWVKVNSNDKNIENITPQNEMESTLSPLAPFVPFALIEPTAFGEIVLGAVALTLIAYNTLTNPFPEPWYTERPADNRTQTFDDNLNLPFPGGSGGGDDDWKKWLIGGGFAGGTAYGAHKYEMKQMQNSQSVRDNTLLKPMIIRR
jgi:RHS repeat-associated protein